MQFADGTVLLDAAEFDALDRYCTTSHARVQELEREMAELKRKYDVVGRAYDKLVFSLGDTTRQLERATLTKSELDWINCAASTLEATVLDDPASLRHEIVRQLRAVLARQEYPQ
jgi:hypothetical protein